MKKPSDTLFRLIHAMSPAEKRYYKMHFSTGANMLTELFNCINGFSEYDEEKVKKRFGDNLKVYKVQLQEILLKALTAYRSKKNVRSKIRLLLEEVDLLLEKQLHDIAGSRLQKAKKLAKKFEEQTYLIEIAYLELVLMYIRIEKVGMSQHPIYEEIQRSLQNLQRQFDLGFKGIQLNEHRRIAGPDQLSDAERAALRRQLTEYPFDTDPEQLPFRSRLLFNTASSFIHSLLGEEEQDFYYRRLNMELFTRYDRFQKTLAFNYLGILRNYISMGLGQNDLPAVMEGVNRAKAFIEKNGQMRPQLTFFYQAELQVKFENGHFQTIVEELESQILEHVRRCQVAGERITLFMYVHLALTHQVFGHNRRVQAYLNQVHSAEPDLREYYSELVNIVEMLNHLEANDETSMERQLNALQRQKKKLQNASRLFIAVFDFCRQTIRQPFDKPRLAAALYETVDDYREEFFYVIFTHFKLDRWLAAIANRRTFGEELTNER